MQDFYGGTGRWFPMVFLWFLMVGFGRFPLLVSELSPISFCWKPLETAKPETAFCNEIDRLERGLNQ